MRMKRPFLNIVFYSALFSLAGCQTPPLLKDSSVALEVYVLPVTIDGYAVNMDEADDVRLVLDRRIPELVARKLDDAGVLWKSGSLTEKQRKFIGRYVETMRYVDYLTDEQRLELEAEAMQLWPDPAIVVFPLIEKKDVRLQTGLHMLLCVLAVAARSSPGNPPREISMDLGLFVRRDHGQSPMQLEWTSKPLHWMRDVLGSQGYLKFLDTELNSVIPLKQRRMP